MGLGQLVRGFALSATISLAACSSTYVLPREANYVDAGDHRFSRRGEDVFYDGLLYDRHRYGGRGAPVLEKASGVVIIDVGERVIRLQEERTGRRAEVEPEVIRSSGRCPLSFLWHR